VAIKNKVQLITYPDSLGGNLAALDELLASHLAGLFEGGVHILPPFPSSGDRGFAPLTYKEIEPRFGTWEDIRRIGERVPVVLDLMVNHISRQSPYFQDFLKKGRRSRYGDLFITLDKIWPGGDPPPADVARIFLRRPHHPFSTVQIPETGETEQIWTTFGNQDPSEQIDLDVRSDATQQLLTEFLALFRQQGVQMVRLDAVGYVIKAPGTSCFMVEPAIYEFLEWLTGVAAGMGLELLPEVHADYATRFRLAQHGYWSYDFVLPLLVLHTLLSKSSARLREYLKICPRQQFTMLDCHDGIPVLPDVQGILSNAQAQRVVAVCVARGANVSQLLSAGRAAGGFDAHQINCAYYSALDGDDDVYLAARAIQFFAPGVPQVYYVGLLAGRNDQTAVQATGEGRAINRHNYGVREIEQALDTEVVQRLLKLIRFRNEYPAFEGEFSVLDSSDAGLSLAWQKSDKRCQLTVDLDTYAAVIAYTGDRGERVEYRV
jgi:sucrose phosphorylase